MKMNWKIAAFLVASLITLPVLQSRAQDSADQTNDVLILKQLMAKNNVVTNTAGIVLVKISSGVWAGKFETIQSAYQKIAHANPSAFQGANRPVDSVSWNDAMALLRGTYHEGTIRQRIAGWLQLYITDPRSMADASWAMPR